MSFNLATLQRHFFDRQKVHKLAEKKSRQAQAKFGAFVRRRAKSSIRKSKKTSAPGQPPKSHVGTLKNLIFFSFDPKTESTVIGPVKFGLGLAPKALEYGGMSIRSRRIKAASGEKLVAKKPVKIRARPFMNPALRAELPKFPGMFRG